MFAFTVFLQGMLWNLVFNVPCQFPPTSAITQSQQVCMFKCLHSKSCYSHLNCPVSLLLPPKFNKHATACQSWHLPHGKEGSELKRFLCLCFSPLNFSAFFWYLHFMSVPVSRVWTDKWYCLIALIFLLFPNSSWIWLWQAKLDGGSRCLVVRQPSHHLRPQNCSQSLC